MKICFIIALISSIAFIAVVLYNFRVNNVFTDSQHEQMIHLTHDINDDTEIKELFKNQSVKFEDIKCCWKKGRAWYWLYVNKEDFNVLPILERIKAVALKDNLKSLRPIISIQFQYGTPETATGEPFEKKDILLD